MSHSIVSPSGAATWRHCSMSTMMRIMYPEEDSCAAMEGTAAHWVAWEMFKGAKVARDDIAPNGVVVTDEMLDGAELLMDVVRTRIGDIHPNIEETLPVPTLNNEPGTPDLWAYTKGTVIIFEYKFGVKYVEEFENDQGALYADAIITEVASRLGLGYGQFDQQTDVEFHIVQPRCFYKGRPHRVWKFRASDIRGQLNVLKDKAERIMAGELQATVNANCQYCPGRHACDALQLSAYNSAQLSSQSMPLDMTAAAMSRELRILENAKTTLDARIEGMQEALIFQIKSGQSAPFHSLKQGYGNLKWNQSDSMVLALGATLGVNLAKESVVTPSQAIKLGIDRSIVENYANRELGKVSLVQEDPANVKKVFSNG